MVIRSSDIRKFFLLGFLVICIIFPGDPYGIKLMFLALLFVSGTNVLLSQRSIQKYRYLYIMGLVFPLVVALSSMIVGGRVNSSISGAYPAVIILAAVIVLECKIDYEAMMFRLLQIVAIMTLAIVLLDAAGFTNVNGDNLIRNVFYALDMGVMGKSQRYALYYKVFFKSSPLLIMLIPYCFQKGKKIMAALTLAALVLSGTRANIFIASVVYVFGFVDIWSNNKKNNKTRLVLGVFIVIFIIAMIPNIIAMISAIMNKSGSLSSDLIRLGQIASFREVFSNPSTLFFGMGFGTSFYDAGRMAYTTASEIAYLDLLRKIGLIWFVPFMVFVLRPLRWRMEVHTKIAYIGYLLICFTNPLLFSSTAYVLYIYLYTTYGYGAHRITTKQELKYAA